MRRDYDWHLNNLFDTMWAARILGYPRWGWPACWRSSTTSSTSKRFRKPTGASGRFPTAELAYAQMDTHYLLASARPAGEPNWRQRARLEEAQRDIRRAGARPLPNNGFDPDGFWHMNGVTI